MDAYRWSNFVHLVFAIVLTGQALFWFIMLVALRQRFDAAETERYLGIVNRARWPHVAVPYELRIPLSLMSWLVLVVLAATGSVILALDGVPQNALWWTKLCLFAAILVVQALLSRRPAAVAIRLNIALVLAIVLVSAWAIR